MRTLGCKLTPIHNTLAKIRRLISDISPIIHIILDWTSEIVVTTRDQTFMLGSI